MRELGAVLYALRKNATPRRTIVESNRLVYDSLPLSYELKTHLSPREKQLKLAAVMLYWAEGYKTGKVIDFTNSDPPMVLLFRNFLSEICAIDESRLRAAIYCYENQDVAALTEFWSDYLQIPIKQFTKPYVKKSAEPGPVVRA